MRVPSSKLLGVRESSLSLRPFFSFYGGKWRDALKNYPQPVFDDVVEPFAGSAGYSLRFPWKNVTLCEIDPVIASVWRFLIEAPESEVLAIPDLEVGSTIEDLRVCQEARWLVGMWLNRGASRPRRSPSRWMRDGIRPGSFWGERVRQMIASQMQFIRHWKVLNVSYVEAPMSMRATWFVDPPYQVAGEHYRFGSAGIDYRHLARWCRSLKGQVVVCENEGADWLPFEPLADVKTTRRERRSREVIWTRRR